MGWREDVAGVIERLPARFTLRDVYRHVPELHRKHRNTRRIREEIRKHLDALQREGLIQALESEDQFLRLSPTVAPTEELELEPNAITTRDELADLMGYDSSSHHLRRGMFKPAQGPLRDHLFLFHDEADNPYGDVDEGDRVYYIGQGQEGDQTLTSYNKYLAEHLERGLSVHYFVQPEDMPGKVRYRGEVVMEKVRRVHRPEEGRSVLQFTLVPVKDADMGDPVDDFGNEYAEILEYDRPPGPTIPARRTTLACRVARDAAFREVLMFLYDRHCAICGKPLRRENAIDVQGAHIMAKAESGPDDPRNGLLLCARHHWAFDHGIFGLTDSHKVVTYSAEPDPHEEIIPGERIRLPDSRSDHPHEVYLSHHRRKWQVA